MTKGLAVAATMALLLTAAASAAVPAEVYAGLVAKAERGEQLDYQALRIAYTRTPQYDPYLLARKPFMSTMLALYKKDRGRMCAMLEATLRLHYADPVLHGFRLGCRQGSGDMPTLLRAMSVSSGLLAAVETTGDGKSLVTAYRIVTFGEIGPVLGLFHISIDGVEEIKTGGHHYLLVVGPVFASHPQQPAKWLKICFNIDSFAASSKPRPAEFLAYHPK